MEERDIERKAGKAEWKEKRKSGAKIRGREEMGPRLCFPLSLTF